jgi:anti-sigma factor RsiW
MRPSRTHSKNLGNDECSKPRVSRTDPVRAAGRTLGTEGGAASGYAPSDAASSSTSRVTSTAPYSLRRRPSGAAFHHATR